MRWKRTRPFLSSLACKYFCLIPSYCFLKQLYIKSLVTHIYSQVSTNIFHVTRSENGNKSRQVKCFTHMGAMHTHKFVQKIPPVYNWFFRSLVKNGCVRMELYLSESHHLLYRGDWRYRIPNIEVSQIASLENFQQQQRLKGIYRITRRENNINKMLMFHITSNKRLGRKPTSIFERAITSLSVYIS